MSEILSLIPQYFVPFIIVLTIVVFVHEFGHYWIARRCGVKVEIFSIGFGPELFGFNDSHGTRWKFSLVPLGGYVKMYGDANPASTPDAEVVTMTEEQKKVSFFHQSVNKRFAVVAAGPAFNYIFAVIVFAGLFALSGQPYTPADVGAVQEGGAAAEAGLNTGDRVTAIDGERVDRFEDIQRIISLNAGSPVVMSILREGEAMNINITPRLTEVEDRFGGKHRLGRIGIGSNGVEIRKLAPLQALQASVVETWNLTVSTLKAVGQMIMGTRSPEELGGALRIAKMSGDVASERSWVTFVWFLAVISINLGLINLFPIPLLDGGHLVFYAAEKLRGRPLSERIQDMGAKVGLAIVLSLMLFATWNDLIQLRVISYLKNIFS